MLIKLELVAESDVVPFMKQFDQLDADGSGMLDQNDLEKAAELTANRLGRDRVHTLSPSAAPPVGGGVEMSGGGMRGFGRESFARFVGSSISGGAGGAPGLARQLGPTGAGSRPLAARR